MRGRILIATALLASLPPALAPAQTSAEDAVCSRLLPAKELAAAVGGNMALQSFYDPSPHEWSCRWLASGEPPRRLGVRYLRVGADRVRDTLMDALLGMPSGSSAKTENVTGVGSVGVLTLHEGSWTLVARTADVVFEVTAAGVTRDQMLAVSRRVAAIAPATLDAAHAALAKARGKTPTPFAPLPPLPDVVVRRGGQPIECERMLPRAEVTAVLGDAYRLADANDPRPGFSFCEWKRPTDDYTISLRVHGGDEFTTQKMAGPAELFAFEVGLSPCGSKSVEPVPGLGREAVICSSGARYHTVIIRRDRDVIVLSAPDASRADALALARAAVR